jgi:hypothetical protein
MSGTIFYRERRKVKDGEKKPRFRVVAVAGGDLKIYSDHLRMSELEQIAEVSGSNLILLRQGKKKNKDS